MRRIFYSLITVLIFFSSIHSSANGIDDFNLKNYVYDHEGVPVFIKIYIDSPKEKSSNHNKSSAPSQLDSLEQILNRMAQNDLRGTYIAVPIAKKKNKKDNDDEDKDESTWECPYCGRTNKASSNYCETPGCVLHR